MTVSNLAPDLPMIKLDTTLTDLYHKASDSLRHKQIGQVLSGFSALLDLAPAIPPNRKFIYQDSPFTSDHDSSDSETASTAIKYLSLITQRDAFIAGPSPTIFFHMGSSMPRRRSDQEQAIQSLSALGDSQRPTLVFCDGPRCIPVEEAGIDLIACKLVNDDLERYDNVVPLETHWFLNSKRALADSGLPTPKCVAVAVDGCPAEAASCCSPCADLDADIFVISDSCKGQRGEWLKQQSKRFYDAINSHPLPFVLKNQETVGGAGTFFVRNQEERCSIIESLGKGFLARLLSTVNASNSHLEPATLLLFDLVVDPVGDYGVTFFVNEKGRESTFLGVSKQMIEGDAAWVGSTIDYNQQDKLRHKFGSIINEVSEWLQGYHYIGPCGADILETNDGKYYIVDLNVRTTGSCCLPLMRTHFTQRGLHFASTFSINTDMSRKDFIRAFHEEFRQGRLCLPSWYEDGETGTSLAEVVVGGEDEQRAKEIMGRIQEISKNVIF